jgi:hypothetical protein
MQSKATTVEGYLAELPEDRREAIQAVRETILKNLDKDYEEGMLYGMIGYYVPHRIYPAGYHCDPKQPIGFAGLASQKNYMSLYMMCFYGSSGEREWFENEWAKTGKKLDRGKSCIRFKKLDELPLDVVGKAIKRITAQKFIAFYEQAMKMNQQRVAQKKSAPKKTVKKKAAVKKGTKKQPAKRKR